jgi:Ca2+-binding EF-hand superfamily protein
MLSLAGTAASGIIDLISSLKQTGDSGKNKSGATAQSAFLPVAQSAAADASAAGSATATSSSAVSTETMRALLWLQSHGVDMSSNIMSALDSDSSGGVSKSEFEQMFAKSGDATKADAAFAKLDTDADGAVSAQELAAGLRSGGRHHGPADAASANGKGDNGDSSQTTTNADGSTTTTITYSDGSQVTMMRPATSTDSGALTNLLERLIQRQADMLTRTTNGQTLATAA